MRHRTTLLCGRWVTRSFRSSRAWGSFQQRARLFRMVRLSPLRQRVSASTILDASSVAILPGTKDIVSSEHVICDHSGRCAIDKISLAHAIGNAALHLERHDLFEGPR